MFLPQRNINKLRDSSIPPSFLGFFPYNNSVTAHKKVFSYQQNHAGVLYCAA
jgi:hypothetical protein